MKGVKFLSLKRELQETCLLPHKLEIVDAVLRDLEAGRCRDDTSIAYAVLPAIVCSPTDEIVHPVEEIDGTPWPETAKFAVKTPFLASVQYDCLDGCADTIYNMIRPFESSKVSGPPVSLRSGGNLETTYYENQSLTQHSSETVGCDQGRKLEELSKWRQQLMAKLLSYDITGTVVLSDSAREN